MCTELTTRGQLAERTHLPNNSPAATLIWHSGCYQQADVRVYGRLDGWKINVTFQHKNKLHRGQGVGWRFRSARLRMASDTVTSGPRCFLFSDDPKWKRTEEAHSSYHASAYNNRATDVHSGPILFKAKKSQYGSTYGWEAGPILTGAMG